MYLKHESKTGHFNMRKQLKVSVWDTDFLGVTSHISDSSSRWSTGARARAHIRTELSRNRTSEQTVRHQHFGSNKYLTWNETTFMGAFSRYFLRAIQKWTDLLFLKPNERHLAFSFFSPQIWQSKRDIATAQKSVTKLPVWCVPNVSAMLVVLSPRDERKVSILRRS